MAKYTITNRYRVIEVGALEMPYTENDEHGYICVDCGMEVGMAYFLAHDKAEAISRIGTEDGEVCASCLTHRLVQFPHDIEPLPSAPTNGLREDVWCDNCTSATTEEEHRCRADEDSCVDGKLCLDYVDFCACTICNKGD